MSTLEALKARNAELTSLAEEVLVARENAALESLLGTNTRASLLSEGMLNPGDPILTRSDIQKEIGFGESHIGPYQSQADDYLRGQCKPFYECEQDLQSMRGIGRYLSGADEMAIAVLANIRNYTIGEGAAVTVQARQGRGGEAYVAALQEFVDEFLDANDFTNEGESRVLLSSVTDGEHLLWLRNQGPRAPRIRYVGGEQITEPDQPQQIEQHFGLWGLCWAFGVATNHLDYETIHGYFVDWYGVGGENWDFVPAAESVFFKRNVPTVCKRGINDFYVPYRTLSRAAKLTDYVGKGSIIQASIAGIKEVAASSQQSTLENALRGRLTASDAQVVTNDGRTVTVTGETVLGGRMINTTGKYHHGPMGTPQGPVFVEVVQMLARRVGMRWCMPEYMISADASNANFSSTLVAGAPFVNQIRFEQASLADKEQELLWKAVDMAAKHGRFGGAQARDLYRLCEIQVEFPPPENVDAKQQEEIRDAQQNAGILSPKTRAAQSNLDYEQEIANGAKRTEPVQPMGLPGMPPAGGVVNPAVATSRLESLAEQALGRLVR